MKPLDKLCGILGRECNGKALRKGDLVELARPPSKTPEEARGVLVVLGMEPNQELYPGEIEVLCPSKRNRCALPRDLRKIDNPDNASWSSITESTSWTPRTIEEEVVV